MNQVTAPKPMHVQIEERTFSFAEKIRVFVYKAPFSPLRSKDIDQLLRSSGSIGANYIEAQEAVSKRDFIYRIKICRKESKETVFWLRLLYSTIPSSLQSECEQLQKEADEFVRMFSAVVNTTKKRYANEL